MSSFFTSNYNVLKLTVIVEFIITGMMVGWTFAAWSDPPAMYISKETVVVHQAASITAMVGSILVVVLDSMFLLMAFVRGFTVQQKQHNRDMEKLKTGQQRHEE